VQPAEPEDVDVRGILGGIHRIAPVAAPKAHLLASGIGVTWAQEAQQLLRDDWGVDADIWSVTSWTELRRDAVAAEEEEFLGQGSRVPFIRQQLADAHGPVVAVSDYAKDWADSVRQFVPNDWATLGADGFGFSDTRAAARRYFKIDGPSVVVRTLQLLAKRGEVDAAVPAQAAEKYRLLDVNAGSSGSDAE